MLPVNECIGGDDEGGPVLAFIADMLLLPTEPPAAAQTNNLLSFPPDASHWLSGDHFKPHTS